MPAQNPADYDTYREIMDELLRPIPRHGLDNDTLKRLYESKLVYLANLRVKCFQAVNGQRPGGYFSMDDYRLILQAQRETRKHLRDLILMAIGMALRSRSLP